MPDVNSRTLRIAGGHQPAETQVVAVPGRGMCHTGPLFLQQRAPGETGPPSLTSTALELCSDCCPALCEGSAQARCLERLGMLSSFSLSPPPPSPVHCMILGGAAAPGLILIHEESCWKKPSKTIKAKLCLTPTLSTSPEH